MDGFSIFRFMHHQKKRASQNGNSLHEETYSENVMYMYLPAFFLEGYILTESCKVRNKTIGKVFSKRID